MSKIIFQIALVFLLLSAANIQTISQQLACKQRALTALRPIPKLKYQCREGDIGDYHEKILKYPERVRAIDRYIKTLETFTDNGWWTTDVRDLNVCQFRQKAGTLSKEEKTEYEQSFFPELDGNNQFRLLRISDPCYQTQYNGSNLFLLYRGKGGRVFVTEILDGYFSRSDYGPGIDFAVHNGEQLIEIYSLSGGLYATLTNYYFTIDKKTNRAVPKNLFLDDGNKLTNKITSMMLLGESEEYGLPPKLEPLEVFKNNRLANRFDIFIDTGETLRDGNQRKFERLTLRWNGKFYR